MNEASTSGESQGVLVPDVFTQFLKLFKILLDVSHGSRNSWRRLAHENAIMERKIKIEQGQIKFQPRPRKTGTYRYGGER